MTEFFTGGGLGMYPIALFGFATVACAVLFVLRPERRFLPAVVAFGTTTLASGVLGFCLGISSILNIIAQVNEKDQRAILAMGTSEILNDLILALLLVVVAAFIVAVGTVRSARAPIAA